jgi:hypothetical protein
MFKVGLRLEVKDYPNHRLPFANDNHTTPRSGCKNMYQLGERAFGGI